MSSRLDWEVTRGDTDTLDFAVSYLVGGVWLTDITGAEVRFRIRDTREATGLVTPMPDVNLANLAAGGSDAQILITDPPAGAIEVYLADDTLDGLTGTSGEYVRLRYELEVLRTNGQRRTHADGFLIVLIDAEPSP